MTSPKPPGRTTRLGYGNSHQKRRKAWAPVVALGHVPCRRCGKRIKPGQPWDLGHFDNRDLPTQPEHRSCNRGQPWRRRDALRRGNAPAPRRAPALNALFGPKP